MACDACLIRRGMTFTYRQARVTKGVCPLAFRRILLENSCSASYTALSMRKDLDPERLGDLEDWHGNNIAFACPLCGKVYIVSAQLGGGVRKCPKCGKYQGVVRGGKLSGGTASIVWSE